LGGSMRAPRVVQRKRIPISGAGGDLSLVGGDL
jgi:hypothetical protein